MGITSLQNGLAKWNPDMNSVEVHPQLSHDGTITKCECSSPCSLDQWIHYFFTSLSSLQLVNLLKIHWNHLVYRDNFCYSVNIQWMVSWWVLVHSGRKELPVIYWICMIVWGWDYNGNFLDFIWSHHFLGKFGNHDCKTSVVSFLGICVFFFQSWRKWPIVSWDFWLPVVCYFL